MYVLVTVLAFILWLVILFAALRYFGGQFFHEPRRAEVAALGVTVAFAAGTLWQLWVHAAGAPSSPGPVNVAANAPTATSVAATSAPAVVHVLPPRDVSAACRSAKDPVSEPKQS